MNGICILLLAAASAFGLAKWLRLPPIPLLMLVGTGLHELANIWSIEVPETLLGEMMELGLAVLVFTAGVDLSRGGCSGAHDRLSSWRSFNFAVSAWPES